MAWAGIANQLLQIDTGKARTYLYNKALSPISVYSDIGEVQVLGQRYVSVDNTTASNPFGSPAILQLVKYLSTSALTTANLTTFGGPVPVWWTDNTFTTVSAISTEGIQLNFPAGILLPNVIDISGLTAAQLLGAQCLISVAGYVKGAFINGAGVAGVGNWVIPVAGTGTTTGLAPGTAPGFNIFGVQMTALASGLADILVKADII